MSHMQDLLRSRTLRLKLNKMHIYDQTKNILKPRASLQVEVMRTQPPPVTSSQNTLKIRVWLHL